MAEHTYSIRVRPASDRVGFWWQISVDGEYVTGGHTETGQQALADAKEALHYVD